MRCAASTACCFDKRVDTHSRKLVTLSRLNPRTLNEHEAFVKRHDSTESGELKNGQSCKAKPSIGVAEIWGCCQSQGALAPFDRVASRLKPEPKNRVGLKRRPFVGLMMLASVHYEKAGFMLS